MSVKVIKSIKARSIIDCIGFPALEVEVETKDGTFTASAPNGMECQTEPMHISRDCYVEFDGRGIEKAIERVNKVLAKAIINHVQSCAHQHDIDAFLLKLDGTSQKTQIGANVTLAISLAILKAGAAELKIPIYTHIRRMLRCHLKNESFNEFQYKMPVPHFDMIVGGKLGENALPFHSIYVVPTKVKSFQEALKVGCTIHHNLRNLIMERYGIQAAFVTAKGAFCPPLEDADKGLRLVSKAINKSGYCGSVAIGLEAHGKSMMHPHFGDYDLFPRQPFDRKQLLRGSKLEQVYLDIIKNYPICSIDDPFFECDTTSWRSLMDRCAVQVTGDDLVQSQMNLLKDAIEKKIVSAATIRPIQLGTFTEVMQFVAHCHVNKIEAIMCHRTGETESELLAQLAAGLGCSQVKFGAPCRSERTAKYNALLRMEEEITFKASYNDKLFKRFDCFGMNKYKIGTEDQDDCNLVKNS